MPLTEVLCILRAPSRYRNLATIKNNKTEAASKAIDISKSIILPDVTNADIKPDTGSTYCNVVPNPARIVISEFTST